MDNQKKVKVKIIWVKTAYDSDYDYERLAIMAVVNTKDWEEITLEEAFFLRSHFKQTNSFGEFPIVLFEDDVSIAQRLTDVKAIVARLEQEREAAAKAAAAKAAKRRESQLAKQRAKEEKKQRAA